MLYMEFLEIIDDVDFFPPYLVRLLSLFRKSGH